jgi:hypothetical protein
MVMKKPAILSCDAGEESRVLAADVSMHLVDILVEDVQSFCRE